MRVLHLNNPAQVASNLVRAQRSLGVESSLVVTSTKGWHSNFDHNLSDIDTRQVQGKLSGGKKLYGLIKDCDILHYHGQAVSEGYRDLVMWSGIMNKPVILHHHGSEIRNKQYPKFASKLVKHRYVSTPDLLEFVPDAEWLPNPVNLDNLEYSETGTDGPLKILHAPTNRQVKNTAAVLDAISQVEMDGLDIQFTLVENVQHSELIEQVSKNDLVIDWLNPEFGIYGVFSIESMAQGRTVICTLTDSLYGKYDLPIISIQPEDLVSKITEIYNDRQILADRGRSGHDFVQKYHNPMESAKTVIERYKAVLG
ncbi:MAG: glycosyltransferase [Candidatus Poseidoniia archaeon]|nr:glycosyltransferase [Candidatus Poseidoniia archaeon]